VSTTFLDPYIPLQSAVHRLDARVKLPLALVFILVTAFTPHGAWAAYLLLWAILLAAVTLSELGITLVVKRALLALPFMLAALPVLFTMQGAPLFSFSVGAVDLSVSQAGVERFLSIALKSWISVQCAVLLAASTQITDLLKAMRTMRIPRLLVAIVGLMYRYLYVMVAEVQRLLTARTARSSESGHTDYKTGGSLRWRASVTGGMAGNLLLRSFERSDRVYSAMLARGYDGEVRAYPQPGLSKHNKLILVFGLTVLFLILLLGLLIG